MKKRIFCGLLVSGWVAVACSSGSDGPPAVPPNSSALCATQFDALEPRCPVGAASRDANVGQCQEQQQHYAGIGCLGQFDAWLSCTTTNVYHCENDTGCEISQAGYFDCQSQAVRRTGCVRLGAQDKTRCSDAAKPYAFGCLSGAPSQCVQVVTEGAGIWCCPQL